ncbi:MAG: signal recognition particle protein Srp19 [archaeon GB-1867-005]|nr:signal recognition particle protein Srp19 [Candidatus Culexmicrobium cathedralense]
MRKRDKVVVWPIYFNSKVSRSYGRKVPLSLSVEDPKLEEVVEAARKAGFNPITEVDKAYPKMWWKEKGRILVEKRASKTKILKEIALALKEIRRKKGRSS